MQQNRKSRNTEYSNDRSDVYAAGDNRGNNTKVIPAGDTRDNDTTVVVPALVLIVYGGCVCGGDEGWYVVDATTDDCSQ